MQAILWSWAGSVALFAADAGERRRRPSAGPGRADPLSDIVHSPLPILIALVAVFYFIVMRPQHREQARRRAMLAAVKKNDRVVTAGGIYGVVTNVHQEADEVTVKVDEATNTKLRVTLSSIVRVLGSEQSDEAAKK